MENKKRLTYNYIYLVHKTPESAQEFVDKIKTNPLLAMMIVKGSQQQPTVGEYDEQDVKDLKSMVFTGVEIDGTTVIVKSNRLDKDGNIIPPQGREIPTERWRDFKGNMRSAAKEIINRVRNL